MTFPHHDLWLRPVLDQQYHGDSWAAVQTRLMDLVEKGRLFFHAWPTKEWAAPDAALEKNQRLLGGFPYADVDVVCPGSGPDGSLTLRKSLVLTCVGWNADPMILGFGTKMTLEIGNVSPILTYNRLSMDGAIVRFPYDFDDQRVSPHLFILATPYRAELNPYP
jgi:hypothetical protein